MMLVTGIGSIHQYITESPKWTCIGPRDFHYLAYQCSGSVLHHVDGKKLYVNTGYLLFLNRLNTYDAETLENGNSIVIAFQADNMPSSFCMDCTHTPQVLQYYHQMVAHRHLDLPENTYFCFAKLYELLEHIQKIWGSTYVSGNSNRKICEIYDYIITHYDDPTLSYEELCLRCGISERYLQILFKNKYGISPYKFLVKTRIQEAVRLLESSELSTAQIAHAVGIRDMYYFSKLFKRHTNLSPKEFKNQLKLGLIKSENGEWFYR